MTYEDPVLERWCYLVMHLRKQSYLYHNHGTQEITDSQYDKMFRELTRIETERPELSVPFSPTQLVGAPPPPREEDL